MRNDVEVEVEQMNEQAVFLPVLEALYDAVMVTDSNGVIILANQAALDSFSLTREQLIGKTPSQLIAEGVYLNSSITKAIETRDTVTEIIHFPNGARRLSTSVPMFNAEGDLSMVITNSRAEDILNEFSKQLAYEQGLHEKYQEIAAYLTDIRTDKVIYCSNQMKDIMSICNIISGADSTVMLLGESGVGKEVIAHHIHNNSPRRKNAFIPINCAAISKELFESELFGYAPHAFTGASSKGKNGLIKLAHNGTLFLDEVAELPLDMQTKLLRFLSTKMFIPVGSNKPEEVDVRIITATNQDLLQMTREKTFRTDLYYRLNVIPIRIPPLRERIEDIKVLSEAFLATYNQKYKKAILFAEQEMELLKAYPWPGNVRELKNIIERTVVMCQQENVGDFLQASLFGTNGMDVLNYGEGFHIRFDLPLKDALESFENYYINAVLEENHGALNEAAKVLDIHRTTLYRKKNPEPKARLSTQDKGPGKNDEQACVGTDDV